MKTIFTFLGTLLCASAFAQLTQVAPPTGSDLLDVFFTDNSTGYVLIDDSVYKTTDGGSTWTGQNPCDGQAFPNTVFISSFFTSASNGVICGSAGRVYTTTNGGSTWTEHSTPDVPASSFDLYGTASLNKLFFVDASTGWAVGDSGKIWKTTDGCASWTRQTTGTLEPLYDVFFTSASNGWACGKNRTLLKTTNGGSTWTAASVGTGATVVNHIHGVAQIGNAVFLADAAGLVNKSTDGGSSFSNPSATSMAGINALCMVDANNGWLVGQAGKVSYTTNGGTSWTAATVPNSNFKAMKSVRFVAGGNGWICANSGLLYKIAGSTTGIQNIAATSLHVYPNPAQSLVHISAAGSISNIRLADMSGKVLFETAGTGLNEQQVELPVYVSKGLYLLQVQTENGLSTQKLVVR